jgi:hypothetical protein
MEIFNSSLDQPWRVEINRELYTIEDFPFYDSSPLPGHYNVVGNLCGPRYIQTIMKYPWRHDFIIMKILTQQCPYWFKIWRHIINQYEDELKIIYITRANPVHITISFFRAFLKKNWCNPIQYPLNETLFTPIHIQPDVFLEYLLDLKVTHDYFKTRLRGRKNVLYLTYEGLIDGWNSTMELVQDFIGMSIEQLDPQTLKQITMKHSDIVDNYDELQQYFVGTEWEKYF